MQLTSTVAPTTIAAQKAQKENGIGKSDLNRQDFLNLLVEQLKNQDPLNPTDNSEFMAQTTAFSQLDEMQTMNNSLTSMLDILKAQNTSQSGLFSAANFIGKEIEFSTNTIDVGEDITSSNMSFYVASDIVPSKTQINVYNEAGELAAYFMPGTQVAKGSNTIPWDGIGVGGVRVPNGKYSFEVLAYDEEGGKVDVQSYGTAVVKGVKEVNNTLYFDTGSGVVSSEYVYSVSAPKTAEGNEG